MENFNAYIENLTANRNAKVSTAECRAHAEGYYSNACAVLLGYVVAAVDNFGDAVADTRIGAVHRVADSAKEAYVASVMASVGVNDPKAKALSDANKKLRTSAMAQADGVKCRVLWAVKEHPEAVDDFVANGAFLVECYKNKDGTSKQKKAAREAAAKAEAEAAAAAAEAAAAEAFKAGACAALEANRMTVETAIAFLSDNMSDAAVIAFASIVAKAQREAAKAQREAA